MEQFDAQNSQNQNRRKVVRRKDSSRRTAFFLLMWGIVIGALIYGSYYQIEKTKAEIQEEIDASFSYIEQVNTVAMDDLNHRLKEIEDDMDAIVDALEETGKEVSLAGVETRQELSEKMEKLDAQLEELKKSLEILKESNGAIN